MSKLLEMKGRNQAVNNLHKWCIFLRMPCGNCHFSVPQYNYDEGCFDDGAGICALRNISLDDGSFKGYELPQEKIDELADRG